MKVCATVGVTVYNRHSGVEEIATFSLLGMSVGTILTTSCYCLSQEVDGHCIAEVQ